jgi:hypothetical protein
LRLGLWRLFLTVALIAVLTIVIIGLFDLKLMVDLVSRGIATVVVIGIFWTIVRGILINRR